MNVAFWTIQVGVAVVLVTAASVRAARYDFARQRMAWVGAVPRALLVFISVAEIAGGLGLILPGLTRTALYLTPVAAVGLALVQLLAISFHASRHEPRNAAANAFLVAILLFLALGRTSLAPL